MDKIMNTEGMDATQLLKVAIINLAIEWGQVDVNQIDMEDDINKDNMDEVYEDLKDDGFLDDCDSEVRESGIPSYLPSKDSSRHYDCEEVAVQVGDQWVGFTYWSGGGKHGEPESIDWMEKAYLLEATPKVITAYDFKKL